MKACVLLFGFFATMFSFKQDTFPTKKNIHIRLKTSTKLKQFHLGFFSGNGKLEKIKIGQEKFSIQPKQYFSINLFSIKTFHSTLITGLKSPCRIQKELIQMLPWVPMNRKSNQSIIFLLSQFSVVEYFSRSYLLKLLVWLIFLPSNDDCSIHGPNPAKHFTHVLQLTQSP